MGISSVFIGSYPDWPDSSVTIDGSGETITASKGGLYLVHETDTTLSLVAQFLAAMTAAGVTNPACFIAQDRKVRLTADANFTVTWGDARVATYLGFDSTANLSGASSYTADEPSPLLWSPGMTDSPTATPLSVNGRKVHDVISGTAPGGAQFTRQLSSLREYDYEFGSVLLERHATAADAGGEYFRFFEEVLVGGRRMFHYREVTEDDSSATAMTLTGGIGPMRQRPDGTIRPRNERMAGLERVDAYFVHRIHAWQTTEYTA